MTTVSRSGDHFWRCASSGAVSSSGGVTRASREPAIVLRWASGQAADGLDFSAQNGRLLSSMTSERNQEEKKIGVLTELSLPVMLCFLALSSAFRCSALSDDVLPQEGPAINSLQPSPRNDGNARNNTPPARRLLKTSENRPPPPPERDGIQR
ncbi:unnamed protein product [Gadus morhua 'NCC']